MSVTIRTITSELLQDLKVKNLDERLPRQYIYRKLVDKARRFIKQDNITKLFNQASLFTKVPCVEMVTKPIWECSNLHYPSLETLQRSRFKLPELYETNYGRYLLNVTNLSSTLSYTPTSLKEYQSLVKLEKRDPRIRYFWIENGYLIIPDSEVEMVNISGIFPEPDQAMKISSCYNDSNDPCKSPLDGLFICPEYLIDSVKESVLQSLLATRNITPDENPDSNINSRV